MPFVWNQQKDCVEEKSEAEIQAHEDEIDAREKSPEPAKGQQKPVPHMKTAGRVFRRMTDEEIEAWQAREARKAAARG